MKGICAYLGSVCVGMVMLSFNAVGGVFTPLKSTDQSFVEQKSTNSLISMTTEQLSKILARKNSMTKNFNGYTNGIKMTSMKFSSEKHARQYIDSVDVGDFYYMPSGVRNLKRSRSRVLLRSAEKVVGTQIPAELSKNSVARLVEHNLLKSTNSITKWSIGQIVNTDDIVAKDRSDNTKNDNSGKLAKFSNKETIVKELSECRLKLADFNIKVDPVFVDAKSGMMCTVEYELVICLANGVDAKKFFGADWEEVSPIPGTSDQFVLSLRVETAEDVLLQAREYSKKDGVVWAEPNMSREYVKNKVLNDTYWSDLWHLKNSPSKGSVNAQDAWDTATGENVVIAVVDDGVEIAHEDLAANIYSNDGEIAGNGIDDDGNGYIDDVNGWNFVDNTKNANPIDADDAHGTSVAGMAAAVGNNGKGVAGAAYKAKILPVKISKGSTWATDAAIASAIRYAAGLTGDGWRGADVINCSWGGGDASSVQTSAFSDAASRGRNGKGCPIFCASGNSAASWWITGISGIPAGDYEFKWTYTKDGSGSVGYDCAWISCVMIGNTILSGSDFVTAGNEPWTICNGPDGLVLGNGAVVPTFKSGDVGDYESSILRCAVRFNGGSITYMYRVDAEIALDNLGNFYAYDGLSFSINGNTQISQVEHAFDYILNAGMVSFNCSNPAAYSSTIAVGASTSYDFRSPYSQFGASLDFVAPSDGDGFVDDFFGVFTAPMSTDRTGSYGYASGNYTTFGGTSSASPLAAGVGALVLSKNPTLTAEEVRTILRKSCDKIGEYSYSGGISGAGGRNDVYGYGRINAKKALEITPASSSSQPPAAPVISSVTTTDSSCAKITWNTVAGATRYDLYRNTSSSRPSSAYKTNVTSPYSDTGATPGTTYYYWVAAVNSAGTSYSSVASGKRAESLTVSSSSITAEASGKSGTISVTANCGWTASKSVSWITVSPASGTGNGSISYTISANTTSSSRSGTITVRSSGGISRTISVSQAAGSQGGGGSDDEDLPNLQFVAWEEWGHEYCLFPSVNGDGIPNWLIEQGEEFCIEFGYYNSGEGTASGTIDLGVGIISEKENDIVFSGSMAEEINLESGYGYDMPLSHDSWVDLPSGVYLAFATLDGDDLLPESDEEDNISTIPFAIYDPVSLGEALGCTALTFTSTGGTWYGTRGDGPNDVTARTKHIGDNGTNVLSTVVSGAGTISFKWKVSSEANYDSLKFVVDGTVVKTISGTDAGWQDVTYTIASAGQHRIEWRFGKDFSAFDGFDCAWLSNVAWVGSTPPPAAPVISSVTTTDSSCAKITWNTVAGATRYDLYRNTSSSRPSSAYKTNVTSPYSDTGATPGTTYYYWVAAVNSAGTSYSSVASGKRAESLTVSSSSITAEASGKSGTISVTANCGWTASKSVSWITVSPASGTGNGSISYTISANTTSSSRSGTITVRSSGGISRTISVSQDSASLPDLVIDAWDEWSHGYGIFTTGYPVTDIETCQPNFLFNKGTQFSLVYGIWNYGEGAVDSTIGMQLTFQRENPVHDESWLWDFTEEASWETGYGMVDAGWSTTWCDLPAGVYLASLLVDSDNDVEETDEDNNYFSVPFAIYDPIPLSEALGNAELTFNTSNNAWYGTRGDGPDGVTARTKHFGNNASNILSAEVSGAGTISFKWRVSSEEEYDVLDFIVDGEIIESISGNGDGWQDVTYEIETDGKHRLEWRYAKDDSYFSGFDCAWLSNMDWEPAGPQWTIENGVLTSVDLKGEKNVTIPNGVWKIGYYAFGGDYLVESVTIPNTVTHIDEYAFSGCWKLSSVVIPNSVVSIGDYAFFDCGRITEITIPKNVSEIGAGAFSMCPISAFAVSSENKNYKAVSGLLLSKDGTRLVAVPDKMKNLVVPSGVTTIAEGAAVAASCTNAVLPSSLALIDHEAFSCAGLKTISIPSSVKIIADYAFADCIDMVQVTLAEGVTSIGEYAFGGIGAKSIRIPMSVKDIGGGAFAYCDNLTEATVPYLLKNKIENDDWPVFEDCPSSLKITYYTVVTFNANGGTGSATRTVTYGAGVGTLPAPTRSGYDFLGWFTAANGGTKISATTKVTSNVTYYAHWIQRCTITFNANSGAGGTTRTVANGAAVGTLPTPTRTGYNFLGWFTAINGGTKISATTKVTSNVTYYAHWEIKRYTITFNANGGTGGTTRTVSHGSKIGTLPVPARNGYAFLGWYSSSNGGNKISSATVVTSSSTYYAQWEPYRLTSDVNGLAPEDSASVYDGYLYMVDEFVGTIQVKVSKPKKGIANVMASIQIAGAKKVNLKGKMDVIEGFFEAETKDGRWLWLEFGVNGLIGNFDGYDIDGVRNLFSSKDKSDKEIVQSAVAQWVGTMNMIWGDGILSISIAKSGKVTIKGNVTVDSKEEKVSLTMQALIGENHLCIPVLYSKKSIVLTFVVWLPLEGGEVEIVGISDAFIGGAGNLKAIASFKIDDDASFWKLLPGRILKECLPNNLAIINNGKKWVLPKAGKVVYLKGTNEIDWSKAKENPSGLKLSYKSKDGSFSGSFKVYSEVNGKPKPTSVSVKGVLINGVGYGIATIKKVGSIDIVIE